MIIKVTAEIILELFLLIILLGCFFVLVLIFCKIRKIKNFATLSDIKEVIYSLRDIRIKDSSFDAMPLFRATINTYISRSEEKYNIHLSPQAKTLLIVPLVDYYKDSGINNQNDIIWQESLTSIFITLNELANEDSYNYTSRIRRVNSMAVLNAFKINWCSIPPFCRPPDR